MRVLAWLIVLTAQCLKVSGRCGESLTIMKKGMGVNKKNLKRGLRVSA